jgi:tRNA dimethylallyltransferase
MFNNKPTITVLVGPTASGKTETAIKLAKTTNSEIINADSRQIYRELAIGTAKPCWESKSKTKNSTLALLLNKEEGTGILINGVEHYGVDICSVVDEFNVAMFLDYFNKVAKLILAKGKNIILTGGTGLYIDACMNGLANIPEIPMDIKSKVNEIITTKGLETAVSILRENDKITQLDEKNPRRVARALEVYFSTNIPLAEWHLKTQKNEEYNFDILGLKLDRNVLYQRIDSRVEKMLANGMLEEAKFLKNLNFSEEEIKKTGIGYNHLIKFLDNKISLEDAKELIKKDTRHYAKRQITWFARYENVNWLDL